ncbi:hypothetical protein I4F81_003202 [Pyropia yezoensis]|uniref:Uncharacterized protein n=1 Tax=Pyropia yezoensis TaxID=2788 RepID=A0ACC3BRJ3_PYRYE|nr:hypothetical protein I4F81_003202 [Neopyropia yezoensis]
MRGRGDGCGWENTPNKTRAREHLIGCVAAKRSFPEKMGALAPAVNLPGTLPPATGEQLHQWRLLWVEAMCESCLPLGFFETPPWQAALAFVSRGRFMPGNRRMLASTYVPLVAAKSDARVVERISPMVRMRSAGVNNGTFVFGSGCAAHAGNLVAEDAAKIQPFSLALRSSLAMTGFFSRC